jgi:hypothetical protein
MDPFASQTKMLELAYEMASRGSTGEAETLRRFRIVYRHLATSVHSVMVELGQGAYGPVGPGFPMPDPAKLLTETEKELEGL